jgi:hypothetical protein
MAICPMSTIRTSLERTFNVLTVFEAISSKIYLPLAFMVKDDLSEQCGAQTRKNGVSGLFCQQQTVALLIVIQPLGPHARGCNL